MEASVRARPGLNFIVATRDELRRLLQKKKYQLVQTQDDQSDPQSQSQPVYLVPHKFPFIFPVLGRDLGSDGRVERLADTIRKINTFRRVQLVRSSIPRKIIFANLASHAGQSVGLGNIRLTVHHPLSDSLIGASRHDAFEIVHNKKLQCAVIDLEERSRDVEASQVMLNANCSALEISIAFAQYVKTQRFILFFKPFNTIKAADLFYCLIKLNSSLTLKLYFLPDGPLTSPESHQLVPHQARFNLSKIQIEIGSQDKEESLLSKGSFLSAIRRAQQRASDANYRINVVRPDLLKQYRPYDSLSAKLLGELDRRNPQRYEAQPQASMSPRQKPEEGEPKAIQGSEGSDSIQFSKEISDSSSGLYLFTPTLHKAGNPNVRDPYSLHNGRAGSTRNEVAKKAEKLASSQQTLQPLLNNWLAAPASTSVDSAMKSEQRRSDLARNPGALSARPLACADESVDDQGLGLIPVLQLSPGFARYEYRAEAVCSRGDRHTSPDNSFRPPPGLHAPRKPQGISSEPIQSAAIREPDDAAMDSRQRSDTWAEDHLGLSGRTGSD